MIKERIYAYLESEARSFDEAALDAVVSDFRSMFFRRFMRERRKDRDGDEYATLVTHPCSRKASYRALRVPEDRPMDARAHLNFYCGDVVELSVLSLAVLAGCDITRPYDLVRRAGAAQYERMVATRDGVSIGCWPDGIMQANDVWMNVEVKKMNDYAYEEMERTGKLDDAWGYRTQTALEVEAWREKGFGVEGTLMLAVKGLTGHLQEVFVPYEAPLSEAAFGRLAESRAARSARDVRLSGGVPVVLDDLLPPRAFVPVAETRADRREKGRRIPTGRLKLCPQCAYCGHQQTCWGKDNIRVEFKGDRPTFYYEPKRQEALPLAAAGGAS